MHLSRAGRPYDPGHDKRILSGGAARPGPAAKKERKFREMILPLVAILAASSLEVPFVAQRKDTCGAAALAMVLRYWGDDATHDDVARTLLTPELHGIAGSRLAEFARGRGMEAVAYKGDMANLREFVGKGRPLIVAWAMGRDRYHDVVVVGFDDERGAVVVHNPAAGPSRAVKQRAFESRWAGAGYWTLLVARDKAVAAPPTYEELVARGVAAGRGGNYGEAEQTLERAIGLAPSRPEARVELAGLRFLEKKYEDAAAGFASALIYQHDPYAREMLAASLHLAGHTEDALKEWNRLGQPRLDQIEIKGLVQTHDRVARRELILSPESVLDLGAYRETRLRLEELGIFSRIELRPLPKQPGHVDLEVDLAERHGFGGLVEIATRGAVNAIRKKVVVRYFDLGGEGINLGLDYKWQTTQPHLKGSVEWPRPFGLPANLRVEALRARPSYDLGGPFTLRTRGGDVSLRRVVGPGTVAEVGWRVRDRTYSIARPNAPDGRISGYELGLDHRLVDRRRNRFDVSARFFQALSSLGSDLSYPLGQVALRYHGSLSLPDGKPIIRSALAAQLILGRGGRRTPLDEMFTPGASSEMEYPLRGHYTRRRGILGGTAIGKDLDLLNVELRQRLADAAHFQLGAVAFYDGARLETTAQGGSRRMHDLGLGLRLASRGLLLRLDYGRSMSGDGKNAWTGGLGQVF
jgi:tetratricopeptide (TPR) repeat protein